MNSILRFLLVTAAVCVASFAFAAGREKSARPERVSHGQTIKLEDYLVPGKTVVFDFTSQYCPPCRAIAPHLDKLHEKRDDIVVVSVDINRPDVQGIDWQSPVARQYDVHSIPAFKVYGPDGKLVAEGDKARTMVVGWFED
jgi:thioredoxin